MTDKELYEAAMLSLNELPAQYLSLHEAKILDILQEVLPMDYRPGSEAAEVVLALLTGEGPESVAQYALDPKETRRLYGAMQDAKTEGDWTKRSEALGWHCLEALEPIWTEELLPIS